MKSNLKIDVLLIAGLLSVLLSGCSGYTTVGGKVPDENEVMEAVRRECPTEQYELVSKEVTKSLPAEVTYHFKSTERDLEFDAISSVKNLSFFKPGDTPIYYKDIEVGYADAVSDFYCDDDFFELHNEICDGGFTLYFDDESDFKQIAKDIVKLSDEYAAENEYNTEEWMRKHPLLEPICVVWVSDIDNTKEAEKVRMAKIDINGCVTYDEVMDILKNEYAQKLQD